MDKSRNNIKRIKQKAPIYTDQKFILTVMIVLMSIITTIFNANFFTFRNIVNILLQISVISIVSAGATFVMISGNFDISVGSMVGLATTSSAILVIEGYSIFFSMTMGVVICIIAGLVNGVIIAKTRTPSFIITLATLSIYHGISLIITGGITKSLRGKFSTLGRGTTFGFIPNPVLVMLGVYIFLGVILKYTKFGRRVFAIGGNEEAAYLSGINTDMNKILIYGLNGLLVGVASIVLLSRLGSALPSTGSGMELTAIAAVVIGGVPLTGGKGSAWGTFLGVVLMGLISNVLNLLNISAYYQEVAVGLIIAIAVIISNIGEMRRK